MSVSMASATSKRNSWSPRVISSPGCSSRDSCAGRFTGSPRFRRCHRLLVGVVVRVLPLDLHRR
ncbi:hypothetical protein ABZ372_50860, partial [Streptomyces sp. NPDC005921]